MIATEELKLNLGGVGDARKMERIPGFKTVDCQPGELTDIVADISKLPMEDGTVSEIYASHCLEHFPHVRTLEVLKEWRRVLRPGAKAYISVPSFDQIVKIYQKLGHMEPWVRFLLYGDQLGKDRYHYITFTFPYLASVVIEAGFSDVKKIMEMPYGVGDASALLDNIHRIPISVSVEATA